ncbi:MAG: OmpP1/FadL family transporter [Candidatus Aminicenantaceae bacterium]
MKRVKTLFSIAILLLFLSTLCLANGLNLNSLGTRALTMGGAFIGLADDFSTIYWNPAGIAQFDKKYLSFYGTDIIPYGAFKFVRTYPGAGPVTLVDTETQTKHYLSGLAAYYHPVSDKIVAGLGIYVPAGLGTEWNGQAFILIQNNNPNINWNSRIGLVTIAPAVAYKVNDKIHLGTSLNINYGMFDLKRHAGILPPLSCS